MAFSMSNVVGIFLLGLLLASSAAEAAGSHQTAPAPAADCSSLVLNMADCLSFVTSGSTVKKPEGTCCDGLKHVLKTDADCLCEAFKNSAQLGVTLNVTKALSLPAACRVSAPSVSNCGLSNGSPALSPVALTPGGSVFAPTPSGGAGAASDAAGQPAPAPGTSGSTVVSASFGMMAIAIACLALF